jgi:8-oxo-dGTP pyrophosphatase MutT (NUDIX family)
MLVRDNPNVVAARGASTTEVFMLKRNAGMAFAPDMHVFPGGGVDPRDGELGLPWGGPSPLEWGERLGCSPVEAQLFVAAAVREVFEEVGVLLASPSASGPVAWLDVSDARHWRNQLLTRERSLSQVLLDAGLVLRSDLVAAKAHWLTPTFEPRRYDTWFFAALMPGNQLADGDTTEAAEAEWVVPEQLLESYAAGLALMLPPTVVCVEQIRDALDAASFVTHSAELPLIMPEVIDTPTGPAMRFDDQPSDPGPSWGAL